MNILGKFLANRDNNIRYVALNTLIKVVAVEPNAVQRHRNTILDCLRDPDISIRRRALDLSFTLINEQNVRVLIRELLSFLEVADNEFKPIMTTQIGIAADRFAPNKRWHIDTMLRVLKLVCASPPMPIRTFTDVSTRPAITSKSRFSRLSSVSLQTPPTFKPTPCRSCMPASRTTLRKKVLLWLVRGRLASTVIRCCVAASMKRRSW